MNLIKIVTYITRYGKNPYLDWENGLDKQTQVVIANRLDRVRLGNFGNTKSIQGGKGIKEFIIEFGPGYRIYYGMEEKMVVILLIAGSKRSQERDIEKAKKYWIDYKQG